MTTAPYLDDWTAEDYRRELHKAGYGFAVRNLANGLDPAGVLAAYSALAADSLWPFSAESRRGVEDAIEYLRAKEGVKVFCLRPEP